MSPSFVRCKFGRMTAKEFDCLGQITKTISFGCKESKNELGFSRRQLETTQRSRWGKLTDQDLVAIEGKREQLVGKLQERYGIAKEEAEAELKRFSNEVKA